MLNQAMPMTFMSPSLRDQVLNHAIPMTFIASLAKLFYRVSAIGSQKCLRPVTYRFVTL